MVKKRPVTIGEDNGSMLWTELYLPKISMLKS